MNETSYVPKSLSPEPKPISPEVLEKFSKGDLQLDQHMLIKGEGISCGLRFNPRQRKKHKTINKIMGINKINFIFIAKISGWRLSIIRPGKSICRPPKSIE